MSEQKTPEPGHGERPAAPEPQRAEPSVASHLPETSGTPAPPVPEPEDPRAARDLAALMFKPALDRGRRVAPAPGPVLATPRPGVAPQLPIAYGARPIPSAAVPPSPPEARPGGDTARLPAADPTSLEAGRAAQPSLARHNRRFSALALGGGAAVLLGTTVGLWAILRLAASWL